MLHRSRVRRVMTAPRRTSAAKGRRRPSAKPPRHQPRQATLLEAPASEPVLAPSDPPSEPPNPLGVLSHRAKRAQGREIDRDLATGAPRVRRRFTGSPFFALDG